MADKDVRTAVAVPTRVITSDGVAQGSTVGYSTFAEFWAAAKAQFKESLIVAVGDETTDLTTGTAKITFRMPYAFELTDIKADVVTAPTGASIIADVNQNGSTIMTTDKLEIEATEDDTDDAATQPALTTTTLAARDKMTIDIDQIGSGTAGAGLKVTLIGYRTA